MAFPNLAQNVTKNSPDSVNDDLACDMAPKNKVSKSANIRNRYNQVPHLTQDTNETRESDKLTVIHHKRKPIGQPFPSR